VVRRTRVFSSAASLRLSSPSDTARWTSSQEAICITVRFGETFVASEGFKLLFREGMTLVEETAAYLDGPGRP
jgi:hypothetical protein